MQGFKGALHTALVDAQMEGEHNSTTCLAEDKCDPLGGHNVWAALPPFPPAGETSPKPAILVLSGMDGQALFHDAIVVSCASYVTMMCCGKPRVQVY